MNPQALAGYIVIDKPGEEVTASTPEHWEVQKGDNICQCYWVPLVPRPTLDHEPQAWKNEYYEKLLASVG